ncbi:MAG: dUTP diphosphatase [Actinomycetota bacterium]|nr:dUTP diphosphatase [Acidimicrobiales bacterium]MEC8827434.1 dUTP diphosphatase [Actinomycetota bacterium]MEC9269105.1 dUTP diphosphatase [Actinomycetota bacterium]MEC9339502.1 dUTP diphosphatase [Actinomycetota bacterium]MED6304458.1 dUTP diphosphatase [Actinomycetota bacterium]
MVTIPVRRLDSGLALPSYAKPGDAGADLVANEEVTLAPGGGRALIGTGIAIAIPTGYAGFVQPRSGLALRHGVTCLNTPGLIDSGYRDELKVLLINTDPTDAYDVRRGDRIAQLVIKKVEEVIWEEADELDETERGLGGFGHSGR